MTLVYSVRLDDVATVNCIGFVHVVTNLNIANTADSIVYHDVVFNFYTFIICQSVAINFLPCTKGLSSRVSGDRVCNNVYS